LCDSLDVSDSSPLVLIPKTNPDPREPVLLLAYAGATDAGEAATSASRFLLDQFSVSNIARIEMEEFLDFTVARPHMRLRDGTDQEIVWPTHEFFLVRMDNQSSDLVLGLGIEPHLRWKAYSRCVVEFAQRLNVRMVVLLGAYLDDVIYSQPVQVTGFSSAPHLTPELNLVSSTYEGPTGIVSVLDQTLSDAGVPALSLWARLPHYISTAPNWRGALALLQGVERVTGIPLELSGLDGTAASFDVTVSKLIAGNPQLSAYVRELKKRAFSQ
jgi:predicted ATP-grasp superfamily ATP-dependent carboligase